MELTDNMGTKWELPELVYEDVLAINRELRKDPVALCLPKTADGHATDLHSPQVQEWFLTWPGAPVFAGALLLAAQAKSIGVNARGFAKLWKAEAVDRLRDAIWEAWIEYLPKQAREQSQQIRRSLEARRAVQSELLLETIELLEKDGSVMVTEAIGKLKTKLASHIQRTTSGDSPDSSGSTPAPTATASSP